MRLPFIKPKRNQVPWAQARSTGREHKIFCRLFGQKNFHEILKTSLTRQKAHQLVGPCENDVIINVKAAADFLHVTDGDLELNSGRAI